MIYPGTIRGMRQLMKVRNRSIGLTVLFIVVSMFSAFGDMVNYAPVSFRSDSTQRNTVHFDPEKNDYLFTYKDGTFDLTYMINSRDTSTIRGLISVQILLSGQNRLIPIYQGGPIVRDESGKNWFPADVGEGRTTKLLAHELKGTQAAFHYEEKIKNQVLHKSYLFSIRGKTLIMEVSGDISNAPAASYVGFDLGKSRLTNAPVLYRFPSIEIPAVCVDKQYFLSTYVDPLLSTTGRYEITEDVLRSRSMQASNTPAWLVEDQNGQRPPLRVTAYMTLSNRVVDVLPGQSASDKSLDTSSSSNLLRDKIVVDLHQLPFAHRPYQSIETIRRWESPKDGWVNLDGVFQLFKGNSNHCSVLLQEANQEKERVLFSQIVDPVEKKSFGIQGRFPIKTGDQLLFSVAGSAMMDGGEVLLDVHLDLEGESYHSSSDYSSEQGSHEWYYEQRIGKERSLMVWNPDRNRWESPFTRSFQNDRVMVCRSGTVGDAFTVAGEFLQDLHRLGVADLCFLVRGWSDHARLAPAPDMDHDEQVWGFVKNLLELSQRENDLGNILVPVVEPESIGLPNLGAGLSELSLLQLPALLQEDWVGKTRGLLRDYVSGIDQKMHRKGLWLDTPSGFDRIKLPALYYQLLKVKEPSTAEVAQWMKRQVDSLREISGTPLFLNWKDPNLRFDFYDGALFDGVSSPLFAKSNAMNLVDEEIHQGRKIPRIGFGSYTGYYQSASANPIADLRLFPLDQYLTSLLAYGRVPYISGEVWFPGMNGREARGYLLETIALVQPVAREYLNPANTVLQIRYQTNTDVGNDLSVEEVIQRNLIDKANRIKIQYANGLQIRANRGGQPWTVDSEILPNSQIAADGFLALNPQTGLLALIGQEGSRVFSVRRTPQSFFLHSRDGGLTRFESFSTDGMMHRWKNPFSTQPDMACLDATEVNCTDPILPLLRSNKRMDCTINWISDRQVELKIIETEAGAVLLEFFDVPQIWFENEGKNLTVEKIQEGNNPPILLDSTNWYLTSSASTRGIRFIDVQSRNRYRITFKNMEPVEKSQVSP